MAKKTVQLGLDGNQAEGGDESEDSDPEEEKEVDKPEEPTDEEVAETKKKEKELAELRKTIEAEIKTEIAKKKAEKELAEADEKEKVPEAVKQYADVLRARLGDTYPEAFNSLKIRARTIAMLAFLDYKDKVTKSAPTPKGERTIPKPTTKSTKKKSRLNASNSYKEKGKTFAWNEQFN